MINSSYIQMKEECVEEPQNPSYCFDIQALRQARDEDFAAFQWTLKHNLMPIHRMTDGFFTKNQRTTSITHRMAQYIIASTCTSFTDFITEIKQEASLHTEYQKIEQSVFPSFTMDYTSISRKYPNETLLIHIPPQYKAYLHAIHGVKGEPLTNVCALIAAYAIGFGPYVLGNIVTSHLSHVAFFDRLLLSASPIGMGGFLRFWVANQVDAGHGKKASLSLLFLGLLGLTGLTILINTIDFERVKAADRYYWALFICNLLSGAGVANYSSSVPMSAQCAPNDTPTRWQERMQTFNIDHPGYLTQHLAPILRQNAKTYVAIVAGIGSLAPSTTLLIAVSLIQYIGLKGIYALFGTTSFIGICITANFLQDSVLDQLRKQNVPQAIAKEIASFMGQTLQSHPDLTLWQRLNRLNKPQIVALMVACFNYVTTFGLLLATTSTGTLVLSRRGISSESASYYTAAISGLSSITRTLLAFHPFQMDSSVITNVGFVIMIVTSLIFALTDQENIWLPMLMLFSIANGISNYGVFAQISDTLSDVIGLASGLAGATGAISGFFICIAAAILARTDHKTGVTVSGIEQTSTANAYLLITTFSTLSLSINLMHEHYRRASMVAHTAIEAAIDMDPEHSISLN